MLFEGVKLMVVGMTTVMLFLCLMILFINLVAFLTKAAATREMEVIRKEREMQVQKRKKQFSDTSGSQAEDDIAVIAAAVAAFEGERFARA